MPAATPSEMYAQAHAEFKQGRLQDALQLLDALLKAYPGH